VPAAWRARSLPNLLPRACPEPARNLPRRATDATRNISARPFRRCDCMRWSASEVEPPPARPCVVCAAGLRHAAMVVDERLLVDE